VSNTSNPLPLRPAIDLRSRIESDDHFHATLLEIQRMRVTLRAEAEHGAGFAFENGEIGVFVV
jgi:hypothetical protein